VVEEEHQWILLLNMQLTPDGASVEDTRKLFDNSNRYLKIIKMNK
jgi:hypothetical protein